MMALAETDGRNKEEIEEEENKSKAVIAAKAGNLAVRLTAAAVAAVATLRANKRFAQDTASTSSEIAGPRASTHCERCPAFMVIKAHLSTNTSVVNDE